MSQDNMMLGFNGDAFLDDSAWTADRMEDAFRAGAAQMREMLARFVEHAPGNPNPDPKVIAQSMRLNWVPNWGKDPGMQDDVHSDLWATI